MAKATSYKTRWVICQVGEEWSVDMGWEVIQMIHFEQGRLLVLLRGTEK